MPSPRQYLSHRLRDIGVEERVWPDRDDGFTSLLFRRREFAHLHCADEIDIRLGKQVIKREGLVHRQPSRVHPNRNGSSPWYEMQLTCMADVDEAVRLLRIAIRELQAED